MLPVNEFFLMQLYRFNLFALILDTFSNHILRCMFFDRSNKESIGPEFYAQKFSFTMENLESFFAFGLIDGLPKVLFTAVNGAFPPVCRCKKDMRVYADNRKI